MNLETAIEGSKSEREKQIAYINTHMWNPGKVAQINLSAGQE